MDFLKALQEAEMRGLTRNEFVRIWEYEVKLKLQKEESRTLELKLACAKHQPAAQQSDGFSRQQFKELRQVVNDMKSELLLQNQHQFQELKTQMENQAALVAMMVRGELDGALKNFADGNTAGAYQMSAYDSYQSISDIDDDDCSLQRGNGSEQQQSKYSDVSASTWCLCATTFPGYDPKVSFLTADGSVFKVKDVKNAVSLGDMRVSPFFYLPECPSRVRISVWFNDEKKINAQLAIFGVRDQSLKVCRCFFITGFIKNKSSGGYSPLFEGVSQPLRKLRLHKQMLVKTDICLKTGSGNYKNPTFEELDKRAYVNNNAISIKWIVTSEEVKTDTTKNIYA